MAITINAKGTSIPYFCIGKGGVTIHQGLLDPALSYPVNESDYWLDSTTSAINVRVSDSWQAPGLGPYTFPTNVGNSSQVLTTDGTGNLQWTTSAVSQGSGTNSVNIGYGTHAMAADTIAVGPGANAQVIGQKAYSSGSFMSAGDAQHSVYVLRNETSDNTLTELFTDGTAGQIVMPYNSVFVFDIMVSARRIDSTGGAAGYRFVGVACKDSTAGSVTFAGTPSKTVIGETNVAWDASLSVDPTTGAMSINVIGEVGKTIRWVATVSATEVTN